MTEGHNGDFHERMIILGELGAASFEPWIRRHAAKLGLVQHVAYRGPDRVELVLTGPEELIDMMEVGCSLGPIDVWIQTIERRNIALENT